MKPIILSQQDRFQYVSSLPGELQKKLLDGVRASLVEQGVKDPSTALADAAGSRVVDLEETIHIQYVGRSQAPAALKSFVNATHPSFEVQLRAAEAQSSNRHPTSGKPVKDTER